MFPLQINRSAIIQVLGNFLSRITSVIGKIVDLCGLVLIWLRVKAHNLINRRPNKPQCLTIATKEYSAGLGSTSITVKQATNPMPRRITSQTPDCFWQAIPVKNYTKFIQAPCKVNTADLKPNNIVTVVNAIMDRSAWTNKVSKLLQMHLILRRKPNSENGSSNSPISIQKPSPIGRFLTGQIIKDVLVCHVLPVAVTVFNAYTVQVLLKLTLRHAILLHQIVEAVTGSIEGGSLGKLVGRKHNGWHGTLLSNVKALLSDPQLWKLAPNRASHRSDRNAFKRLGTRLSTASTKGVYHRIPKMSSQMCPEQP